MTDLETACRELLTRWRDAANYAENEGHLREADGINGCVDELEHALEEHTPDAADRLAAQTGDPREKFEADEKEIPELDDLESEVKTLVEQMEDAT